MTNPRRTKRVAQRLFAVLLPLFPSAVHADRIGLVKVQSGDVQIERVGQRTPASVGAPVYRADRIVTGKDGSVGLSLADNAMLSAGPNSILVLDQFNFDPTTHEGNLDVTLRKGTLSAISGKLVAQTPGAMKVRTPAAVLAVRGTEFVVRVENPDE